MERRKNHRKNTHTRHQCQFIARSVQKTFVFFHYRNANAFGTRFRHILLSHVMTQFTIYGMGCRAFVCVCVCVHSSIYISTNPKLLFQRISIHACMRVVLKNLYEWTNEWNVCIWNSHRFVIKFYSTGECICFFHFVYVNGKFVFYYFSPFIFWQMWSIFRVRGGWQGPPFVLVQTAFILLKILKFPTWNSHLNTFVARMLCYPSYRSIWVMTLNNANIISARYVHYICHSDFYHSCSKWIMKKPQNVCKSDRVECRKPEIVCQFKWSHVSNLTESWYNFFFRLKNKQP